MNKEEKEAIAAWRAILLVMIPSLITITIIGVGMAIVVYLMRLAWRLAG